MKMMHQSRTCERNSWTTTSMVLANRYPNLLQLNLCSIFLGCFALRNIPRTICLFNQKKEEDDQDSGQKMVRSANEINAKDAWCCSKCDLEDRSKETLSNHSHESHVNPTNTCKDRHIILKNMHKLKPHKEVYSSGTPKCKISYSYKGVKNQKEKESFRVGNSTNMEFFDCNECEYISKRTIESKEHLQDHQCKKYKLSHRSDIESMDKQVSSSKDEKKNNNAVSINVPATTYSLDFTCRNCDNPMANYTHPEELMSYYHKAGMKNAEEKSTWLKCGNQRDEETDLRCHIIIIHKEEEKSSVFMDIRLTFIYCAIETEKLGPSWAKQNHN